VDSQQLQIEWNQSVITSIDNPGSFGFFSPQNISSDTQSQSHEMNNKCEVESEMQQNERNETQSIGNEKQSSSIGEETSHVRNNMSRTQNENVFGFTEEEKFALQSLPIRREYLIDVPFREVSKLTK
jgi:hypothetical protein